MGSVTPSFGQRIGSDNFRMQEQIPLDSLECHFSWNICESTQKIIQERILSVQSDLYDNNSRNLPQSYCLLAYLKSKLETNNQLEINSEIHMLFQEAEKHLPKVDNGSTKIGLGYRAVVIGNLAYWETKIERCEQALNHYREYKELEGRYDGNLEFHPEALAMKGFALGYSFGIEKSRLSVDAYEKALSDKHYVNNAEWIYGLAHSKTAVAIIHGPEMEKDLIEIEQLLRRVIFIDPNYSLAMLKLAKILAKLNGILAFDEAEDWINKALHVSERKRSCLEEAASIHQLIIQNKTGQFVTEKNIKKHNVKALELYQEAMRENKHSRRGLVGQGKYYLNNYFEKKNKSSDKKTTGKILPPELKMAQKCFEEVEQPRQHAENLKLADVYREMSLVKGHERFSVKAEKIHQEVITLTRQEKDPVRLMEAYAKYANFLRKIKQGTETAREIDYLIKAVEVTGDCGAEEESEMGFTRKYQDRLLFYASQDRIKIDNRPSKVRSLAVKGHVQRKRGNIMTACYYLKKAVELNEPGVSNEYKRQLREKLARYILESSQKQQPNCTQVMCQVYFDEAKQEIAALGNTNRKYDLECEAAVIEINKLMGQDKHLRRLKEYRLQFEKCRKETNKERLKGIKNTELLTSHEEYQKQMIEESPAELKTVLDIICEFKRVLDGAMNAIKAKIFERSPELKPHFYYPTPRACKLDGKIVEKKRLRELMKKLLETDIKLFNFEIILPEFFDFLIKKQPYSGNEQYEWLQGVIDIRNKIEHPQEHGTKPIEMLRKLCPTREELRSLTEKISKYAVEIKKRVQLEVDNYLKNLKTKEGKVSEDGKA